MAVLGVDTGLVVAQFVIGVVDGPDINDEPDIVPARGSFEFTPSTSYIPVPLGSPNAFTLMKDTVVGILDNEGYLCTPHAYDARMPGKRGLRLFSTDTPNASVSGWTWVVTPKFVNANGAPITSYISPFAIRVPSGGLVDLTLAIKVPESTGVGTGAGTAEILWMATEAQATAKQSKELAQQSVSIALKASEDASQALAAPPTAGGLQLVPDPDYPGLYFIE